MAQISYVNIMARYGAQAIGPALIGPDGLLLSGMTPAINLPSILASGDGVSSAPGHTFTSEQNSGLYRAGAHDVRLSVGGADAIKATSTYVATLLGLVVPNGAAATPSIAFAGGTGTTGFYWVSSGTLGVVSSGTETWRFGPTSILPIAAASYDIGSSSNRVRNIFSTTLQVSNGAVGAPGFTFANDTTSGLYLATATSDLRVALGGADVLKLTTSAVTALQGLNVPVGAVGTPSLSFGADTTTGLYHTNVSQVAIAVAGVLKHQFWATGYFSGADNTMDLGSAVNRWRDAYSMHLFASNGTAPLPSNSFINDKTTGWYLAAALADMRATVNGADVFKVVPGGVDLLGTGKVTSLVDPVSAQDAATKNYVDQLVNGLTWKKEAAWATAAALPVCTYANGTLGVGATLTATGVGALSVDGNTPSVNGRVLVKNQATGGQNGVYTVTTVGDGSTAFVLTRTTDCDQAAEMLGGFTIFVLGGTANAVTAWTMTASGAITVGTTALTWVQVAGPGSYTAGTGIALTGTSIALAAATTVMAYLSGGATADFSLNSHKLTKVANGSASDDAIAYGQVATVGRTGSASDITTGTLAAAQLPAFTGDVTSSAGSSATTIATGAVTSAKILDGTIVDADISATAGIVGTKLAVPVVQRTSRGVVSGDVAYALTTWGNYTAGATVGTAMSTADHDKVVANLATGDWVELSIEGIWGTGAVSAYLSFITLAGSINVLTAAAESSSDAPGMWSGIASQTTPIRGAHLYQVQAGDLSAGSVTFRPRIRCNTATSRTVTGTAASPVTFTARRVNA